MCMRARLCVCVLDCCRRVSTRVSVGPLSLSRSPIIIIINDGGDGDDDDDNDTGGSR
jgi:hypothetical protein